MIIKNPPNNTCCPFTPSRQYSALELAIWIMDSGGFVEHSLPRESYHRLDDINQTYHTYGCQRMMVHADIYAPS